MKAAARFRPQALTLLLFLLFFAAHAVAAPSFPALTGRVVDNAGLLTPAEKNALSAILAQHESNTTDQIVVVTLKDLQGYDIADYGYQLGRHWGIGQKGKDNGALLIVAPDERKVRIEVGYGLEGELTDKLSHDIIQEVILPRFKEGNYPAGILNGTTAILSVLEGSYTPKKRSAGEKSSSSDFSGIIIFAVFIITAIANVLGTLSSRLRLIFGSVTGLVAGAAAWLFTHAVPVVLFVTVFTFLMTAFGRSGVGYSGRGSSDSTWGSGGSSGSSWGGGSFGGGGGSFGGGGASGSW
jgi:uncharacterized protein